MRDLLDRSESFSIRKIQNQSKQFRVKMRQNQAGQTRIFQSRSGYESSDKGLGLDAEEGKDTFPLIIDIFFSMWKR